MNIVTPYPTNIPINTVNVTTESARRDNQLREVIAKPTASEAGVAERGVASEHDKSKPNQQNSNSFEVSLSDAEEAQRIHERDHGEQGGEGQEQQNQQQAEQKTQAKRAEQELEQQETKQIQELKSRDTEVRTHEAAHAATGGQYAGSPTYSFKRGPDGNNYAVGGEVSIDASAIAGDPAATVTKMQQVRAAALAPAEPSGQDRKVAGEATQQISKARADQVKQTAEELKANNEERVEKDEAKAEEAKLDSENKTDAQLKADDPFNLLSGDEAQDIAVNSSNKAFGDVFGVTGQGAPASFGSEEQVNSNRQAADQRNGEVVARAARVQNFYQSSTVPRERSFSQFA